ncbi:hypothetical protein BUY81_10185 [Staphylococcus equorum]|uniref:hypothetical protein n=1 Tax=Staphylococcus equorum TaxID=246432 RepID=UPI000D1C2675|nr:hypothetical protein [Staphylococcus equorum]PTF10538.1 hypothetical protein BUY81_10185 [Staphylococcus equorum]
MYRLAEFQDNYSGDIITKTVVQDVNDFLDEHKVNDFEVINHSTVFMDSKKPMDRITIKYKVK